MKRFQHQGLASIFMPLHADPLTGKRVSYLTVAPKVEADGLYRAVGADRPIRIDETTGIAK
jgi:hypothetical protein